MAEDQKTPTVLARAAKERREDAKRTRADAARIREPIVRDHLLKMADSLDDQAAELEQLQ